MMVPRHSERRGEVRDLLKREASDFHKRMLESEAAELVQDERPHIPS